MTEEENIWMLSYVYMLHMYEMERMKDVVKMCERAW